MSFLFKKKTKEGDKKKSATSSSDSSTSAASLAPPDDSPLRNSSDLTPRGDTKDNKDNEDLVDTGGDGEDDEYDVDFLAKPIEQRREEAIQTLIAIEETYLAVLDDLIKSYIIPLKNGTAKKISKQSPKALGGMFLNIPKLVRTHRALLQAFQERISSPGSEGNIGLVFKAEWENLTSYVRYAKNLPSAIDTINDHAEKSAWKAWFSQVAEEHGKPVAVRSSKSKSKTASKVKKKLHPDDYTRHLRHMLTKPIKHLPQYCEPMKKLLCATPADSADHADVMAATAMISELARIISHLEKQQERRQQMQVMERRILAGRDLRLYSLDRWLIRKGDIECGEPPKQKKAQRRIFLFNDQCIVTEKMNDYIFKMTSRFELDDVTAVIIHPLKGGKYIDFDVQTKNGLYKFSEKAIMAGSDALGRWAAKFDETVYRIRNGEVFNYPLDKLLEKEGAMIPRVVIDCTNYLEKFSDLDGVFFIDGRKRSVRRIRRRYNRGKKLVDLNNSNPFDVSSLLLEFIRRLPTPLITFAEEDLQLSLDMTDEEVIQYLKDLLNNIPEESNEFRLLEFVVYFLSRMCTKVGLSKARQSPEVSAELVEEWMSSVLATSFGMAIFRPECPSVAYVQNAGFVVRAMKIFIAQPNSVFNVHNGEEWTRPGDMLELMNADAFGLWWRKVMSDDKHMIEFVCTDKNIAQLIDMLVITEREWAAADPARRETLERHSFNAGHLLEKISVLEHVAQHDNLLMRFFTSCMPEGSYKSERRIRERSMKHIGSVADLLVSHCTEKVSQFLCANEHVTSLVFSALWSGNAAQFVVHAIGNICAHMNVAPVDAAEGTTPAPLLLLSQWIAHGLDLAVQGGEGGESLEALEALDWLPQVMRCALETLRAQEGGAIEGTNPATWLKLFAHTPIAEALSDRSRWSADLGRVFASLRRPTDPSLRILRVLYEHLTDCSALSSAVPEALAGAFAANARSVCAALECAPGEPVGENRIALLAMLAEVCGVGSEAVAREVAESGVLGAAVGVFKSRPAHSILAAAVTRVLLRAVESSANNNNDAVIRALLLRHHLLDHIIEHGAADADSGAGGGGAFTQQRAHLQRMAMALDDAGHLGPLLSGSEHGTGWSAFRERTLAEVRKQQAGDTTTGRATAPWWFNMRSSYGLA